MNIYTIQMAREMKRRKNGWQCPLSMAQVGVFILLIYTFVAYSISVVLSIPFESNIENITNMSHVIRWYSLPDHYGNEILLLYTSPYLISFILMVICIFTTMTIDPSQKPVQLSIRNTHKYFCDYCQKGAMEKTKHCRVCNKCVPHFDHHCIWLNNCIGDTNYKWFIWTCLSSTINSIVTFGAVVSFITGTDILSQVQRGIPRQTSRKFIATKIHFDYSVIFVTLIFLIIISFVVSFLLISLLIFHVTLYSRNMNTYEWIKQRTKTSPAIVS
ncbi:hypothetical protein SNEBB_009945 [Seison nebaliae]|nr:hypothetical protein SNEBB_009945 [Seison nebaliae]